MGNKIGIKILVQILFASSYFTESSNKLYDIYPFSIETHKRFLCFVFKILLDLPKD